MNLLGSSQVYNVELWSTNGVKLADISRITQNREFILTRNDAEQFTFDLDLTAFETYCTSIGVSPSEILAPYQTDVKLARNGTYLFVVQVVGIEFDFQPNDSGVNTSTGDFTNATTLTETVTVTCTGYLNIFSDRYLTENYTNADPAFIAADLINKAQALTNGNVGVSVPFSLGYLTGTQISPVLTQQQVKQELQLLAELETSPFDFAIDYTKTFNTYPMIGNQRNDLTLVYGGPGSNITGLYHQRTAAGTLYNEVIGEGNGTGNVQLQSIQDNTASQINYFLRQTIQQYSNVSDQSTLVAYTSADLARMSSLLEIPQLIITGALLTNIPFLSIGDRVPLSFPTHPYLSNLNGQYFRIEQMDVKIDDNDFEYKITLTMDNYGLNITL